MGTRQQANRQAWPRPAVLQLPRPVKIPKLDRLARSVPDARAIGDDLVARDIKLSLGGQVYDSTDPMGKMFFNILPPSPNSRSTCCGCALAKAWPWWPCR